MNPFALKLAPFHHFDPQPKEPNRRRVGAQCVIGNGTHITFCFNHGSTLWWVTASKQGVRMARTSQTTSKKVAMQWEEAVIAGRVEILSDDDENSSRARKQRAERVAQRMADRTIKGRYGR